jgi:biopolymer transport protein ExbD
MNFTERPRDGVELNITPLIDVVLLLLIFFMVTTTFNRQSELKIDLPEATADPEQQQEKPLELVIDVAGRYYVEGQAVVNTQPETLIAAMRKALDGRRDRLMVIRADARTPHQSVVTAMDSAARIGLTRLSIATTKVERSP